MALKARNDVHLARRIWHMCGVLTMFSLYVFLTKPQAIAVSIPVCLGLIGLDVGRLYNRQLNRTLTYLLAPFMRDSEMRRPSGLSFMMGGVFLTILIFPKEVVLLALLFFAFADPLASYFGIRYGKDRLVGNKTLQGSMAAFGSCFVLAFLYLSYHGLMTERLFIVCLLAGFIGAISELMPIGRLDDNLVFPVMSSTLLYGLFYVFGGLHYAAPA